MPDVHDRGKLAAQFKEAAKAGGMKKYRVMTDVTGYRELLQTM